MDASVIYAQTKTYVPNDETRATVDLNILNTGKHYFIETSNKSSSSVLNVQTPYAYTASIIGTLDKAICRRNAYAD